MIHFQLLKVDVIFKVYLDMENGFSSVNIMIFRFKILLFWKILVGWYSIFFSMFKKQIRFFKYIHKCQKGFSSISMMSLNFD